MNDQVPKGLKKWEARRKLGRGKYIILYGVIIWGGSVGIIATLIDWWRRGFSVSNLIIAAVIWPLAGWFVGSTIWSKSEEKFRQFVASRHQNA